MLAEKPTDNPDIDSMTKAELIKYAHNNGISGVSNQMTKAEIYDIVLNAVK